MAGFYHFIPEPAGKLVSKRKFVRDVLGEYGLADVLRDCTDAPDHAVVTELPAGPDGKPGTCIYPKSLLGDDPPGWSYRPDHQTWVQSGRRWLGWENEKPPTPVDLVRREIYSDYTVTDKLKQEWHVPCARTVDAGRSSLPVEYAFFPAGGLVHCVAPDFEDLWKLSGEVLDHLRGAKPQDERWQVEAALTVLSVNYRLAKAEATALQAMGRGVLTRLTVRSIMLAFVDNDLEQEALEQKKTPTTQESPDDSAAA